MSIRPTRSSVVTRGQTRSEGAMGGCTSIYDYIIYFAPSELDGVQIAQNSYLAFYQTRPDLGPRFIHSSIFGTTPSGFNPDTCDFLVILSGRCDAVRLPNLGLLLQLEGSVIRLSTDDGCFDSFWEGARQPSPAFEILTTCTTGCKIPLLSRAPRAVPFDQPNFSSIA